MGVVFWLVEYSNCRSGTSTVGSSTWHSFFADSSNME